MFSGSRRLNGCTDGLSVILTKSRWWRWVQGWHWPGRAAWHRSGRRTSCCRIPLLTQRGDLKDKMFVELNKLRFSVMSHNPHLWNKPSMDTLCTGDFEKWRWTVPPVNSGSTRELHPGGKQCLPVPPGVMRGFRSPRVDPEFSWRTAYLHYPRRDWKTSLLSLSSVIVFCHCVPTSVK